MYNNDNSPETVAARSLEDFVAGVCQLLDVKDVFIAEAGSAMDCQLKADIGLELEDGTVLFLQVKSSQQAAQTHMEKKATYKSRQYPAPSVVWLKERNALKLLKELHKELQIPISPAVLDAVQLAKQLKGKVLPLRMLKLNHLQIRALNMLGFAKVIADQIKF